MGREKRESARRLHQQEEDDDPDTFEDEELMLEYEFDVTERSGSVCLKIIKQGAGAKVVLYNEAGEETYCFPAVKISAIRVLNQKTIKLKRAMLTTCTFSFETDGVVEKFLERLFEVDANLEKRVTWKGDSIKRLKRAFTLPRMDKEGEKGTANGGSALGQHDDDDDDDTDSDDEEEEEDEGEHRKPMRDGAHKEEDGDEGKNEDGNLKTGRKSVPIVKRVAMRKKSITKTVKGTEWIQFYVTRYNRFGQSEYCCCLISQTQGLVQILSIQTGITVGVYRIAEIVGFIQHGNSEAALTVKIELSAADPQQKEQQSTKSITLATLRTVDLEDSVHGGNSSGRSTMNTAATLDKRNSIARRLSIRTRDTAKSTRKSVFTGRLKNRGTKNRKEGSIIENLVFESQDDLRSFCKTIKRELNGKLSVEVRKTVDASTYVQEMEGGWNIFMGYNSRRHKRRVLAINPLLGLFYVFRFQDTDEGIIQNYSVPLQKHRFYKPTNIKTKTVQGRTSTVKLEFEGVDFLESELGLDEFGSFDAYATGIRSRDGLWYFRSLAPIEVPDMKHVSLFKFRFNAGSVNEACRLLACMKSMQCIHEEFAMEDETSDGATTPKRKSSRLAQLLGRAGTSNTATPVIPSLTGLSAKPLQYQAWIKDDKSYNSWFSNDERIFVGTFNVGDASAPKTAVLEHWIPSPVGQAPAGSQLSKKFTTTCGTGAEGKYSIYAIGLQEVSTRFDDWTRAIGNHLGDEYKCVVSIKLWEIGLLAFAHESELVHITSIVTAAEKTGIRLGKAVKLGNKGGVGIGFRWRDVPMAFINAHLSAQQNKIVERNDNYKQIMSKLNLATTAGRVQGFPFEPTLAYEHVFFLGDLNYRVDMEFKQTEKAVSMKNWKVLYQNDQLEREMSAGRVFFRFKTAKPDFPPTYRWKRNRRELSNKKDQPASYTDRVLWHSRVGSEDNCAVESYGCAQNIMISDHRPVSMTFKVKVRKEYAWPCHPLLVNTPRGGKGGENGVSTEEKSQFQEQTKRTDPFKGLSSVKTWVDPSSFFMKCNLKGGPVFRLRNVMIKLDAPPDDSGNPLPTWVGIGIHSPMLNDVVLSAFSPGSEKNPELASKDKRVFAFQGVGQWGELYYKFDDACGIPVLKPIMSDPTYLRSQHLLVGVVIPTAKQESQLNSFHGALSDSNYEDRDDSSTTSRAKQSSNIFVGQACLSLRFVLDATSLLISSSGIDSWSKARSPLVPFSEPIIQNGVQIGRMQGEMQLLPPTNDITEFSVVENDSIVKEGEVQITNKKFKIGTMTSAHLFMVLTFEGKLYLFSRQPRRKKASNISSFENLVLEIDVGQNSYQIEEHGPSSFTIHDYAIGLETKNEMLDWITAIEKISSVCHSDASTGTDEGEEYIDEELLFETLPPPPSSGRSDPVSINSSDEEAIDEFSKVVRKTYPRGSKTKLSSSEFHQPPPPPPT